MDDVAEWHWPNDNNDNGNNSNNNNNNNMDNGGIDAMTTPVGRGEEEEQLQLRRRVEQAVARVADELCSTGSGSGEDEVRGECLVAVVEGVERMLGMPLVTAEQRQHMADEQNTLASAATTIPRHALASLLLSLHAQTINVNVTNDTNNANVTNIDAFVPLTPASVLLPSTNNTMNSHSSIVQTKLALAQSSWNRRPSQQHSTSYNNNNINNNATSSVNCSLSHAEMLLASPMLSPIVHRRHNQSASSSSSNSLIAPTSPMPNSPYLDRSDPPLINDTFILHAPSAQADTTIVKQLFAPATPSPANIQPSVSSSSSSSSPTSTIRQLQAHIASLEDTISSNNAKIASLEETIHRLQSSLKDAYASLSTASSQSTSQFNAVQNELDAAKASLNDVELELDRCRLAERKLKQAVREKDTELDSVRMDVEKLRESLKKAEVECTKWMDKVKHMEKDLEEAVYAAKLEKEQWDLERKELEKTVESLKQEYDSVYRQLHSASPVQDSTAQTKDDDEEKAALKQRVEELETMLTESQVFSPSLHLAPTPSVSLSLATELHHDNRHNDRDAMLHEIDSLKSQIEELKKQLAVAQARPIQHTPSTLFKSLPPDQLSTPRLEARFASPLMTRSNSHTSIGEMESTTAVNQETVPKQRVWSMFDKLGTGVESLHASLSPKNQKERDTVSELTNYLTTLKEELKDVLETTAVKVEEAQRKKERLKEKLRAAISELDEKDAYIGTMKEELDSWKLSCGRYEADAKAHEVEKMSLTETVSLLRQSYDDARKALQMVQDENKTLTDRIEVLIAAAAPTHDLRNMGSQTSANDAGESVSIQTDEFIRCHSYVQTETDADVVPRFSTPSPSTKIVASSVRVRKKPNESPPRKPPIHIHLPPSSSSSNSTSWIHRVVWMLVVLGAGTGIGMFMVTHLLRAGHVQLSTSSSTVPIPSDSLGLNNEWYSGIGVSGGTGEEEGRGWYNSNGSYCVETKQGEVCWVESSSSSQ